MSWEIRLTTGEVVDVLWMELRRDGQIYAMVMHRSKAWSSRCTFHKRSGVQCTLFGIHAGPCRYD